MTTLERVRSKPTTGAVRWPHTGITAPHHFDIDGLAHLDTPFGRALSAELVHPDLGVVGRIYNPGGDEPTTFHPYQRDRFSHHALEAFVDETYQDGELLDPSITGVEHLLNAVLREAEVSDMVCRMRRDTKSLVRAEFHRGGVIHRGPIISVGFLLFRHRQRQAINELAACPETRLNDGEAWHMFNGQAWVPLEPEPALSPEQANAGCAEMLTLYKATAAEDGTHVDVAGPLASGMYLTGKATSGGGLFTLTADNPAGVNDWAGLGWCRCKRRARTARFQRWATRDGLHGSGTLHTAPTCRSIVTID